MKIYKSLTGISQLNVVNANQSTSFANNGNIISVIPSFSTNETFIFGKAQMITGTVEATFSTFPGGYVFNEYTVKYVNGIKSITDVNATTPYQFNIHIPYAIASGYITMGNSNSLSNSTQDFAMPFTYLRTGINYPNVILDDIHKILSAGINSYQDIDIKEDSGPWILNGGGIWFDNVGNQIRFSKADGNPFNCSGQLSIRKSSPVSYC